MLNHGKKAKKIKNDIVEKLNTMDLKKLYLEDVEEFVLSEFKKSDLELNFSTLNLVGVEGSLKQYSLVVGNSNYREHFKTKITIITQVPTFTNFYNIIQIY